MQPLLKELKERLLRRGLAPRHVARYLEELEDHLKDLASAGVAAGLSSDKADESAFAKIGTVDALESVACERRELYAWSYRMPWMPFLVLPALAVPIISVGLFFSLGSTYSTRLVGADETHLHWFELAWSILSAFMPRCKRSACIPANFSWPLSIRILSNKPSPYLNPRLATESSLLSAGSISPLKLIYKGVISHVSNLTIYLNIFTPFL